MTKANHAVGSESALSALSALLFDLEERHADELASRHHGDGAEGCSYCADMRQAHIVLASAGWGLRGWRRVPPMPGVPLIGRKIVTRRR